MICETKRALDVKMLPQQNSKTIFINPNFKQTHINPNFLKLRTPNHIHVNPNFIQKPNITGPTIVEKSPIENPQARIITKTRTKLVREASVIPEKAILRPPTMCTQSPLIKIGKRALIRASLVRKKQTTSKMLPQSKSIKKTYKIDRRTQKLTPKKNKSPRKSFISRYALSRSVSESLTGTKVVVTNRKMMKIGSRKVYTIGKKFESKKPADNKIKLVNINGVLYKLNKNTMQKANNYKISSSKPESGRVIFVRGDKFVLDKTGRSLTRVQNPENMKLQRIDIGGMTYVEKSPNIFVRTNIHKVRNHLSIAKQKSINILSRNLVKTNIPCAIFRKVGKCAAFERGKCPKVHDKKQVQICPKFLKGDCTMKNCLLSHEVSLSKMPTCKFFLQGCCVRDECPYLHKKVNDKTDCCIEFQRGFCLLAEKCNKRHDYSRPLNDVKSKDSARKVLPTTTKLKKKGGEIENKVRANHMEPSTSKEKPVSRYFVGDESKSKIKEISKREVDDLSEDKESESDDDSDVECETSSFGRRPKLGHLPSFIPL